MQSLRASGKTRPESGEKQPSATCRVSGFCPGTNSQRTADWDRRKLKLRGAELQVVKEYVRGLEKDFEIGNRIFAVVVSQSPEVTVFRQLEWQRISKIELPYHGWHALIRLHLWTGRISPGELNKFTQVVATLAFQVRRMLNAIEEAGHADVVESVLRDY